MVRETNPKKDQIVDIAKSLFWKYGIRRVSIEEICRESHVSKMTFYKHFKNKNDLVKFILGKITADITAEYQQIMSQDIPFLDKVKQSIALKMRQSAGLSREFFDEMHKTADPEIVEYLNQIVKESITLIYQDYVAAQKRGDVRSDIKPEFIVYFLNHIMEMVEDERLLGQYDRPQDLIMELTNFFFYGILPRQSTE